MPNRSRKNPYSVARWAILLNFAALFVLLAFNLGNLVATHSLSSSSVTVAGLLLAAGIGVLLYSLSDIRSRLFYIAYGISLSLAVLPLAFWSIG